MTTAANANLFSFGYSRGLPASFDRERDFAWGARLIVTPIGRVDLLWDRTSNLGAAGHPAKDCLRIFFENGGWESVKAGIKLQFDEGNLDYRNDKEAVVYRDDYWEVKANCQSSHGYCYVAMYPHGRTDLYKKPATFVAKEFGKTLAYAYLFDEAGAIVDQRRVYFEEDGKLYTQLAYFIMSIENPEYVVSTAPRGYKPKSDEPAETLTVERKVGTGFYDTNLFCRRADGTKVLEVSCRNTEYRAELKRLKFEHPTYTFVEP